MMDFNFPKWARSPDDHLSHLELGPWKAEVTKDPDGEGYDRDAGPEGYVFVISKLEGPLLLENTLDNFDVFFSFEEAEETAVSWIANAAAQVAAIQPFIGSKAPVDVPKLVNAVETELEKQGSAHQQIAALSRFILEEVPGYPRATEEHPNGMGAVEAAVQAIKEYQTISQVLWGLLDSIATLDADWADARAFRGRVRQAVDQRNAFMVAEGGHLFRTRLFDGAAGRFPDPEPERK